MTSVSSSDQSFDIVSKVLVIGESSVGKTALIKRYIDDEYLANHTPTLGIDYQSRVTECGGKKVKLMIFDTAGQEKFKSLTKSYYKRSQAILLVFSIADRASFERIETWIQHVEDEVEQKMIMTLVGNKSDLHKERQIEEEEAKNLAKQYQMNYFEVSAKEGIKVTDAFQDLARQLKVKYGNASESFYKVMPNITPKFEIKTKNSLAISENQQSGNQASSCAKC